MGDQYPDPSSQRLPDADADSSHRPKGAVSPRQRYKLPMAALAAMLAGTALAICLTGRLLHRPADIPPTRRPVVSAEPTVTEQEVPDPVVFTTQTSPPQHTPPLLPAESPEIYCFYDFRHLPPDTQITAYWWLNGEELGQVTASPQPLTEASHAAGRLTLKPPEEQKTFPEGIYEIELRATRKKIDQASFAVAVGGEKILAAKPTAVGQVKVINCVTAQGVSVKGEPEQPTTTFAGSDRIFVVFAYINGTAKVAFVVKWFFRDTLIEQATQRVAMTEGAGRAFAWMHASEPLPSGQYRAEVSLVDIAESLATVQFTVQP